jgi:large subunit ribosomal protein L15
MIRESHLRTRYGVAVLGRGQVTKALNVTAHRFSRGAREKIEQAGGAATVAEK